MRSIEQLAAEMLSRQATLIHRQESSVVELKIDGCTVAIEPMPALVFTVDEQIGFDRIEQRIPLSVPGPECCKALIKAFNLTSEEAQAFKLDEEGQATVFQSMADVLAPAFGKAELRVPRLADIKCDRPIYTGIIRLD